MLRGWSQEELARLSGLSRAGVSAIETGRLIPSAAAALALAAALECRVEDLFRLQGAEPGRGRLGLATPSRAVPVLAGRGPGETEALPRRGDRHRDGPP